MKTIKNFLVDFVVSFLIALPCHFLCDWMSIKGSVDWLDIQIGLAGTSFLLLIAYIFIAQHDKEARIAKITNTMTLTAIVATVIYGVFMLLEWWSPDNADSVCNGTWEQWFPVSISLSIFIYIQEKRMEQNYKNNNDLVVIAEYHDKTEAETICAMLEQKGINAMTVEKGSTMYINTKKNTPVQLQVMNKELQKAKELIK